MHYLSNRDEVFAFISRALSLLKPGGRLLIGDLPNTSKKTRFMKSTAGQRIAKEWADLIMDVGVMVNPDNDVISFDDTVVLDLMTFIRNKGFDSFLLPQPIDLPFGGSREDILVVAYS